MIPNIEKILKEWSYRVGTIKPNDKTHLFQLERILINEGWSHEVINEFIESLTGKSYDFIKDDLLSLVGLLDQKKQPAKLLSLGEQQRLSLVRSLLLKPSLILLDEPTANLDPATTNIIENIIVTSKQFGIKIIFVTHNILQAKRLADEVVFIDNGELVEHSNADNFFSKPKSKIVKNYLEGKL